MLLGRRSRLRYVPLYLVVLCRVEGATPDTRTKGRNCSKSSRQEVSEAVVVNGSFAKQEKTSKLGGWQLVPSWSLIGGLDFATVSGASKLSR